MLGKTLHEKLLGMTAPEVKISPHREAFCSRLFQFPPLSSTVSLKALRHDLPMFLKFVVSNPCQSSPSLTILVSL